MSIARKQKGDRCRNEIAVLLCLMHHEPAPGKLPTRGAFVLKHGVLSVRQTYDFASFVTSIAGAVSASRASCSLSSTNCDASARNFAAVFRTV